MKSNLIYGAVALVMIITIAAFLSEETVQKKPADSQMSLQSIPDGRQPGDQRVRDHAASSGMGKTDNKMSSEKSGRVRTSLGQQNGRRAKSGGSAAMSQGGKGGQGKRQAGSGGSQRNSDRRKASAGVIGKESIPVILNGTKKGEINGRQFVGQIKDVTVMISRGAWQGWGVTDVLKLVGVDEARRATFIDREGNSTTVEWSDLSGQAPAYIFSYTQGGHLLLIAGQEIDMTDPLSRKQKRGKTTQDSGKQRGMIAAKDIVKIELS